jgi:hypothetical protein
MAATMVFLTTLASAASAQTAVDLLPNLIPLPASDVTLVTTISGQSILRFSATNWNNGKGSLQLVAGEVETGSGKQQVYQEVFRSDGSSSLHLAGAFQYHAQHEHIHFDDFALYTLQPVDAPGGSARTGSKVTFCVMDTTKIDGRLPGAPAAAQYANCGNEIQGMSVGWGDTYGSHLPGQDIDVTSAPDGIYQLKIEADPKKLLIETSDNDNVSCALISIQKPSTVRMLDNSGACSAALSISPNSAAAWSCFQSPDCSFSRYLIPGSLSVSSWKPSWRSCAGWVPMPPQISTTLPSALPAPPRASTVHSPAARPISTLSPPTNWV